ncbi:NADH-quinone oxidoreductase subunit N [Gammaproteobacteria bacterium]|nr:NADH-quinone oxidoreductase subunit N [Gammaproteobacteria bacterium]
MIMSLLPEIMVLVGALATLMLSISYRHQTPVVVVFTLLLTLFALSYQVGVGYGHFTTDYFAIGGKQMAVLLTLLISVMIQPVIKKMQLNQGLILTLILLALLGIMVMVSANDYLLLFLGIELVAIPSYILCSMTRYATAADEAGLKYFVLGSISSIFYLYGISLIYGATGSLLLKTDIISNMLLYQSGIAFVFCAFFFKIGLFPFHYWVPDVYQASEMPLSLWVITVPKVGYLLALIRILLGSTDTALDIINIVGCLSLLFGALMACVQDDFRRMLGYASISQMGVVLILVSISTTLSLSIAIAYLLVYLFTICLVWLILLQSVNQEHMTALSDLVTLKHMPLQSGAMGIAVASMAGIPLTLGFVAKVSAIFVMMAAGFYKTLVVFVLSLPIAVYYYLSVIKVMYFSDQPHEHIVKQSHYFTLVFAILLVVLSFLMSAMTYFCNMMIIGVL